MWESNRRPETSPSGASHRPLRTRERALLVLSLSERRKDIAERGSKRWEGQALEELVRLAAGRIRILVIAPEKVTAACLTRKARVGKGREIKGRGGALWDAHEGKLTNQHLVGFLLLFVSLFVLASREAVRAQCLVFCCLLPRAGCARGVRAPPRNTPSSIMPLPLQPPSQSWGTLCKKGYRRL